MTIVVARQFGETIIVLSDTMISGRGLARSNILPGRLKSIVVSDKLSIAYAGAPDPAIDAIRKARSSILRTGDLQRVIHGLLNASKDGNCDFIVSSHVDGVQMYRVWEGKFATGANLYWIGDRDAASMLIELDASASLPNDGPESVYGSEEEHNFSAAITKFWLSRGIQITEGAGGLLINQLGWPYGHCYQGSAGVTAWDATQFPPGLTVEQIQNRSTGMTQYCYSITAPSERGVAVLGVFLEQAKTGFVYTPITRDEPYAMSPTTLGDVGQEVRRMAREMVVTP